MFARNNITYEPVDLPDRLDYSAEQSLAEALAFHDWMKKRHTVRDYAARPVSREVIEACIRTAGTAPSGANHQPWHFAVVSSPEKKRAIREAAEEEERNFYAGKASEEWLTALAPLGTDEDKPFLETAPWLIVVFAQRKGGIEEDGKTQNYYVNESVGIACGMLIATLFWLGALLWCSWKASVPKLWPLGPVTMIAPMAPRLSCACLSRFAYAH